MGTVDRVVGVCRPHWCDLVLVCCRWFCGADTKVIDDPGTAARMAAQGRQDVGAPRKEFILENSLV